MDPPDKLLADALATVRAYGRLDAVFYTDGSVKGGVENGGSAVVESVGEVDSPTFLEERSQSGPKYASSFETESWALWLCISLLVERQCRGRFLICSDSQSSLAALKGGEKANHPILAKIRNQLELVECEVMFQWVPGHVGLKGNERADQVAKAAASLGAGLVRSSLAPISFESARSAITRRVRGNIVISPRASGVYEGPPRRPDGLSRKDEVMLARLRSGHSKHLAAYRGRVQDSDKICPRCGVEEEDLEHFLQRCEATERSRWLTLGEVSPPLSVLCRYPKRVVRFCREIGIT